jgi:hypothetical protein
MFLLLNISIKNFDFQLQALDHRQPSWHGACLFDVLEAGKVQLN